MVEDDVAPRRRQGRRPGPIHDLRRLGQQADHQLHVGQGLLHPAIDRAEQAQGRVELQQIGVDQHEIAHRQGPRRDPATGHQHHRDRPRGDDRRLGEAERELRGLASHRRRLVGAPRHLEPPRLMGLGREILHRLIVEQAVGGLDAGGDVALVHLPTEPHLPAGHGEGDGQIGQDRGQGREREAGAIESPQHAGHQGQFQQGGRDVEQGQVQQALDPRRAAFHHPRHPAGLAVQMEAQRQGMQMLEDLERGQPDRALGDPGEHQLAQPGRRLGDHLRQAIGEDEAHRHDHDRLDREPVDHPLEDQRRADIDQLGRHHQRQGGDHPQLHPRLAPRPEQGREPARDTHGVAWRPARPAG